jgi:hypothetical protein
MDLPAKPSKQREFVEAAMSMPYLIKRNSCAITGNMDLEPLDKPKDFPVFMGCVDSPPAQDVRADLCWSISKNSGLIQLTDLIPLDILYSESHGSGDVGRLWDLHHKAFASFIANNATAQSVFEIGGAHGRLCKEYMQFKNIPWTILEPSPIPIKGCSARFIKGFFDENFCYSEIFDTVVHSHVLEHIYKPADFMNHLSRFMEAGKRLVFSLPNMQVMLERKYTNCINFEHSIFLTEPYVEYLLAKHGFKILAKEYFMDDHSIFYSAIRDANVTPKLLPPGLYEANKKLYTSYVDFHKALIAELNQKMEQNTRSIYLFGAHVFAQHLLEMGLDTDKIVCILDNDPRKQGRRLYGTNLKVSSPTVLAAVKDPVVILKAGVYNDEIKKDILENINESTIFFE